MKARRPPALVREEPRGRERYDHLDPRPLSEVDRWLEAVSQYWERRLAARGELLDQEKRR